MKKIAKFMSLMLAVLCFTLCLVGCDKDAENQLKLINTARLYRTQTTLSVNDALNFSHNPDLYLYFGLYKNGDEYSVLPYFTSEVMSSKNDSAWVEREINSTKLALTKTFNDKVLKLEGSITGETIVITNITKNSIHVAITISANDLVSGEYDLFLA